MRLKINVPDSLNDITLEQYQMFLKMQEEEEDQFVIGSKMIEIFCDIPYKNIIEFRMSHINKISKTLTNIFEQETKILIRHFELDNIKYGFIPSLDEMTFGEYVDLDTYFKDWQNIHRAMGVLYRPLVHKYNDRYTIKKYEGGEFTEMKKMPLDVVFSSIVFFYNLGNDLSKNILDYLSPQEMETFQQLQTSELGGAGISQFMHSLKEILQSTKISLN
tara:strand:- start:718 stop:1371 length:654 start_codon:yes stop_codon:yes gene_type:complete